MMKNIDKNCKQMENDIDWFIWKLKITHRTIYDF